MITLVEFLEARLAEDEQEARACLAEVGRTGYGYPSYPWGSMDRRAMERELAFMARHDPARVLREVEAKRRQLGWAQDLLHDAEDFPADETYRLGAIDALRTHLPLLALPYSGHPDFRAEWSPS